MPSMASVMRVVSGALPVVCDLRASLYLSHGMDTLLPQRMRKCQLAVAREVVELDQLVNDFGLASLFDALRHTAVQVVLEDQRL